MRSIKVGLACAAVVLVAVASYGTIPHVLYGKRIAGQVVDADTGLPIAGVHVAFLWESDITPRGFTAHNSRTVCYHAAATTTDLEGRFQIEPWREWSTYGVEPVDPIALVYARNYAPQQLAVRDGSGDERPTNHLDRALSLKKFPDRRASESMRCSGALSNRDCPYGGSSQKSLYPMLKDVHAEAREIAEFGTSSVRPYPQLPLTAAEAALALDPTGPGDDCSQVSIH